MAHIKLDAEERTQLGTSATRRLRREGKVPGVLYQKGEVGIAFALPERALREVFHGEGGRNAVIDISIAGGAPRPALLKDYQAHPVRDEVTHVDLQQVDLTEAVEAAVPVVLVGTAIGVRDGGVLDQPVRAVTVRALPDALPEHMEHDVSALETGSTLLVGDLAAPEGVEIVDDPANLIASVTLPSAVVEPEEEEEEAVLEGEEAAPEAAETPEAPAAEE
jgi:large subunit ribosomal protein L25